MALIYEEGDLVAYEVFDNTWVAAEVIEEQGGYRGVTIVLVGDDKQRWVSPSRLHPIVEDDYCPSCGQIGCIA